jgi:hypothetical protein
MRKNAYERRAGLGCGTTWHASRRSEEAALNECRSGTCPPRRAEKAFGGRFTRKMRSTILNGANLPPTTRIVCATDANCQRLAVPPQGGTQGGGLPKAAADLKTWMLSLWCQYDSSRSPLWHGKCDTEGRRSILDQNKSHTRRGK